MRGLVAFTCIVAITGCERGASLSTAFPMPTQTLRSIEGAPEVPPIFVVDGGDDPWGDYGSILVHGMCDHVDRDQNGQLQLARTGPFVPPVTFPGIGHIVITDQMKVSMEQAGFTGISFRPVTKSHIVLLNWQEWDLSDEEPKQFPQYGAPEGYLLENEHSATLAESMGPLWEVVLADSAKVLRHKGTDFSEMYFTYVPGTWNGNDLFSVDENSKKYASWRAKQWFDSHFPQWTSFVDAARH